MNARLPTLAAAALLATVATAAAGPIYSFESSVGTQPGSVAVITLTQVDATTVNIFLDFSDTRYGLLNTGGPHTPFAFTLAGAETGLSATFLKPVDGAYALGVFTLSMADGGNTPYGTYGLSIENSAGNGSGNAYYGDLSFNLTRAGGLDTADFIKNANGYFFSADLTDGRNTGAQAWGERETPRPVPAPEPMSLTLFGIGLAGLGAAAWRRRRA